MLATDPEKINASMLEQYPEFLEFKNKKKDKDVKPTAIDFEGALTPEDALASAYSQLRESLESEILETVKEGPPPFLAHPVQAYF